MIMVCSLSKHPGSFLFPALLICRDLILMAQRPADIIDALEQGVFSEMVDIKGQGAPCRCGYGLRGQVNMQAVVLRGFDFREKLLDKRFVDGDGQDAVI